MRSPFSQWIPTKLTSRSASYSILEFVSIPFQPFLGSPLTILFPFSKHVSLLKAKFFPHLKVFCCISASSLGPSKESLSVLYKSFLRPLLTYVLPRWFPFLSITNITKLEYLQAASCAIFSCLWSSPIPFLLSETSLPFLQVTLIYFALSS